MCLMCQGEGDGPKTPNGLGAVTSIRSTGWPPVSTTVAMLAGRNAASAVPRKVRRDLTYAAEDR